MLCRPIVHLPGDEPARWIVHRDRVQTTLTILAALRADPADRDDEFVVTLQDSEQRRLAYIEERLAGRDPGLSFARDIRPMFRFANDIPHMRDFGLDLSDRASVSGMVDPIIKKLRGLDPNDRIMPPPPLVRQSFFASVRAIGAIDEVLSDGVHEGFDLGFGEVDRRPSCAGMFGADTDQFACPFIVRVSHLGRDFPGARLNEVVIVAGVVARHCCHTPHGLYCAGLS